MDSAHEATNLIALEDEQLDAVAGGCGHRGRGHRGGQGGYGGGLAWLQKAFGDIDIDINIVNVQGNVVAAGGNLTIQITQAN